MFQSASGLEIIQGFERQLDFIFKPVISLFNGMANLGEG